jgi:type IV pilus assembly protein PilE
MRGAPRRQGGVTLIELMIVTVVVAILGSIAVASYRGYVQRAARSEAKAALLDAQADLERCFTRFNRYSSATAGDCVAADTLTTGLPTPEGRYTITATFPTTTTYTLTASQRVGGGVTDDAKCRTFTLTNVGARGSTGSASVAECWR